MITGGSIHLGNKECFLITLGALNSLVKLPIDGRSLASKYFRSQQVPDIALYFNGKHAEGGFDVRYMIWGLNRAIAYMVDRQLFFDWRFTLRWQNKFVGYLWYLYERPREGFEANKTSDWSNLTHTGRDIAIFGNGDQNAVFIFHIEGLPSGTLSLNDVMMVIIGGLTDIATNDMAVQVHGNSFHTQLAPYRGRFELMPAASPLYFPSWFTYDVIRQALGSSAAWYVLSETCKPAQILMFRDGQYCGRGSLLVNPAKLVEVGGVEGRERNNTSS